MRIIAAFDTGRTPFADFRTPDRMEMATFPVDALTPANIECAWDFVNFSL